MCILFNIFNCVFDDTKSLKIVKILKLSEAFNTHGKKN